MDAKLERNFIGGYCIHEYSRVEYPGYPAEYTTQIVSVTDIEAELDDAEAFMEAEERAHEDWLAEAGLRYAESGAVYEDYMGARCYNPAEDAYERELEYYGML